MTEPKKKDAEGEENEEDYEEELGEKSDDEQKEEEEEEEDEEEEEEEEEIEETEVKPVKKRRCQRKKKIRICYDDELNEDEELDFVCEEEEEGEEDEEGDEEEEEDEGELLDASSVPSILSAVSFDWEGEPYEFEELCDPGHFQIFQESGISEHEVGDKYGVRRYAEICAALSIVPMGSILRALKTEEMDLSYRNLGTKAIKAISAALETNTTIKSLIAKWNDLRIEDCHYLGHVMSRNGITHLDFTGCSLEPEPLGHLIAFLTKNETVSTLILSRCNIRDEGMKILAYVLSTKSSIENLDLSYNKLEGPSGDSLALVFMSNSTLTALNLHFNNLFEPSSMKNFFRYLSVNYSIIHLDLSWNSLSGVDMGTYIGNFLRKSEAIGYLDLSQNRFEGAAILQIKRGFMKSRTLQTLKLGKNPLSSGDIEELLDGAKYCSSLQVLDLEDLWIEKNNLKILKRIQKDREFEFNYAGILGDYEVVGPDYAKLLFCRAQFEAQKPKKQKKKRDFGHLMWTLGEEPMTVDEFMKRVKKFKAKIAKPLFPELINQFLIPKYKLVDVSTMRQKYLSIFPDSTPPPPPKPKKGKKGKLANEIQAVEEEADERESELMLGEDAGELFIDVAEYEDDEYETEDEEEKEGGEEEKEGGEEEKEQGGEEKEGGEEKQGGEEEKQGGEEEKQGGEENETEQ